MTLTTPVDTKYLACGLDASLFMELAYGLSADPWQAEFLRLTPNRTLLLCSRQSGKSTVCAAKALHKAIFTEGSLILIISNAFRQAQETFRKVKSGLLLFHSKLGIIRENQTELELSNGSRIVSLPGNQESIRSFSAVTFMIIDEASQVADDLYKSVRPMLAVSKGQLVVLSTPWGRRGWFYSAWLTGKDWKKVIVTASSCPRITKEFIEEEKRECGERWVRQEYFCEFVDSEDQVFPHDLILGAFTGDGPELDLPSFR